MRLGIEHLTEGSISSLLLSHEVEVDNAAVDTKMGLDAADSEPMAEKERAKGKK